MTFEAKHIVGKVGIEVTCRAEDKLVAAHFYDKQRLDEEIKQYLIKLVEKS